MSNASLANVDVFREETLVLKTREFDGETLVNVTYHATRRCAHCDDVANRRLLITRNRSRPTVIFV
jgi:hypothetical protein